MAVLRVIGCSGRESHNLWLGTVHTAQTRVLRGADTAFAFIESHSVQPTYVMIRYRSWRWFKRVAAVLGIPAVAVLFLEHGRKFEMLLTFLSLGLARRQQSLPSCFGTRGLRFIHPARVLNFLLKELARMRLTMVTRRYVG